MGLAGFCAAAFFGIVWVILKKVPKLNREGAIPIIILIVKLLFWLSVISVVLAIAAYVYLAKPEARSSAGQEPLKSRFLAELDDSIQQVWLVLRLSETNRFLDFCPLDGGIRIFKTAVNGKLNGVGARFQNGGLTIRDTRGEIVERPASYAVSVVMKFDGTNSLIRGREWSAGKTSMKTMGIPIPLWMVGDGPFRTMRDLHKSKLIFSVSTNVAPKLDRVELVVNGWSILNLDAKGASWIYSPVFDVPFDSKVSLQTLTVPPYYGGTFPWTEALLNVHDLVIRYYPDAATPLSRNDTAGDIFFSGDGFGFPEPIW